MFVLVSQEGEIDMIFLSDIVTFRTSSKGRCLQLLQYFYREKITQMHPGEIIWPVDGFVGENLSCSTLETTGPFLQVTQRKTKPLLQNKAPFRSLNIEIQNVDNFFL